MPRGEILTLEQTWKLARLWYHDRLDRGWRRPTVAETREAFASLGLDGAFWAIP